MVSGKIVPIFTGKWFLVVIACVACYVAGVLEERNG